MTKEKQPIMRLPRGMIEWEEVKKNDTRSTSNECKAVQRQKKTEGEIELRELQAEPGGFYTPSSSGRSGSQAIIHDKAYPS